jgi:hypothetical protein
VVPLALWSVALMLSGGCAPPTAENPSVSAGAVCDTVLPAALRSAALTSRLRPAASVPATARSADAFVNSIGVNLHLSYFRSPYGTGWSNIIKPKLQALGVRHARDAAAVTASDGWMQTVYGRMKELSDQGIRFNLVARLAKGEELATMSQFDRLLSYALPVVESFEGLNEHDLSRRTNWIQEVRTCQQELYTAVKRDPRTASLPVYGPSFGRSGNASLVGDISQWMDVGVIHPYPGGLLPLTNLSDNETRLRSVAGSKPLIATETGYHTATSWTGDHPGVSESAMARYVPRLLLEYFSAGIQRTYLYEFIDEGSDRADREQNFGLLRYDGSEKPAYVSLRNLIALLRDPGAAFSPGQLDYGLNGDLNGVKTLLLQKRDGRFYLAIWQDATSYDLSYESEAVVADRQLTLTLTQAAQVRLFLPLTSPNPTRDMPSATSVTVSVPDSPLIVEIRPLS